MNETEVKKLLVLAMSYDNRKMPAYANVLAWQEQADRNDWTPEAAREAIHRHYASSTDFLMPGHVTAILSEVRKQIRAQFTETVSPPKELRDDPRAEIEWRRKRVADYTQLALAAWASGQEIPALEQRAELGEMDQPQLRWALDDLAARWSFREERPAKPKHRLVRRNSLLDRTKLRLARAELAEVQPVDPEEQAS